MKTICSLLLTGLFAISLHAQDAYHQALLAFLQNDYGVEPSSYVLYDNEAAINDDLFIYGATRLTTTAVSGQTYSTVLTYENPSAQSAPWGAGTGIRNQTAIGAKDIVLISFWGRRLSASSELNLFAENATTFEKEVYFTLELESEWKRYFIAYESADAYAANAFSMGFHLGSIAQEFEIAGFTVLNFGTQYPLTDLPSDIGAGTYGGHEEDAPWRALAASRIESIRKADLTVTVLGDDGQPLEGAEVEVEMQEHAFGFGSAFVGCRFPGNRCYDATYVEKITNLDGKGHGFNVGVTENALKWDAWEEEWIGSPTETISAVRWLSDRGIDIRGHAMVWPGWQYLPEDLSDRRGELDHLRERITDRINRMLMDPSLSSMVTEWDVLNEIAVNRDLENAFRADPDYSTGREVYKEIFDQMESVSPNTLNYINDYVTLSGGGSGQAVINRYKQYIEEIIDSGAKVDGIGFQCHIGLQPTSILRVQEILDEFYQRYNKRMKITEYDIDGKVDDATEAKYLADFLTMVFSHPGVDAFIMWGFWDNNHWKSNAPMFASDWSLKPSGQAFIDKVFKEWWTEEIQQSGADGKAVFRPFKGIHKITVRKDGQEVVQEVELNGDDNIEISLMTSSQQDLEQPMFQLSPNPMRDQLLIEFAAHLPAAQLDIYSMDGRLQQAFRNIQTGESLSLPLPAGMYVARLQAGVHHFVQKLVIEK